MKVGPIFSDCRPWSRHPPIFFVSFSFHLSFVAPVTVK